MGDLNERIAEKLEELETGDIDRLIKEGIELPESMRAEPRFRNMQHMHLDEAF